MLASGSEVYGLSRAAWGKKLMSVIVAGDMTPSFQEKIAAARAIPQHSRSFLHRCLLVVDDAGARDGRAGLPVSSLTDF